MQFNSKKKQKFNYISFNYVVIDRVLCESYLSETEHWQEFVVKCGDTRAGECNCLVTTGDALSFA